MPIILSSEKEITALFCVRYENLKEVVRFKNRKIEIKVKSIETAL